MYLKKISVNTVFVYLFSLKIFVYIAKKKKKDLILVNGDVINLKTD